MIGCTPQPTLTDAEQYDPLLLMRIGSLDHTGREAAVVEISRSNKGEARYNGPYVGSPTSSASYQQKGQVFRNLIRLMHSPSSIFSRHSLHIDCNLRRKTTQIMSVDRQLAGSPTSDNRDGERPTDKDPERGLLKLKVCEMTTLLHRRRPNILT